MTMSPGPFGCGLRLVAGKGGGYAHAAHTSHVFDTRMYFVHSFCPLVSDANRDWVLTTTDYGRTFASCVQRGRVMGTQFHPEVFHTPDGAKLLANFARHVCGLSGDWTMAEYRATKIAEIREQVGDAKVICGLSGGVDSSVAAILIHEAIGEQLTCVFVDHGLLRLGEREQVETMFREGGATKGACSPADMIADCARFPVGIWTVPEVAFVGLTAAAAEEQGINVVEGLGKYSESIRGHVHTVGTTKEGEYLQMRGGKQPRITGQTLKLVATRAAPHTVVGVHIFGDDACELVHFGTTLVQAQKTLAEVLQVCYAAVTYHELFKLAARDALSTVVADGWRDVYRQINHGSETTPAHAEEWLTGQGVEAEAVANVVKAMFASGAVLGEDSFLRRVGRLQGPLGLDRVDT